MTGMAVRRVHLPEAVREGLRLGRHVHHDDASRYFPADRAAALKSVTHQAVGLPLDQGDIGSCTANALCGALNSLPDHKSTDEVRNEDDARHLYGLETQMEGEPWPPNDPGGSGLMVCRAAKQLGWISSYRHAFGIDQALHALVLRPVIIGINWYSSFDTPDPHSGEIKVDAGATIRGGHEVLVDSIDADHETIGLWNSWGTSWGLGGRFVMAWALLERLLNEDGDVTVPHR